MPNGTLLALLRRGKLVQMFDQVSIAPTSSPWIDTSDIDWIVMEGIGFSSQQTDVEVQGSNAKDQPDMATDGTVIGNLFDQPGWHLVPQGEVPHWVKLKLRTVGGGDVLDIYALMRRL